MGKIQRKRDEIEEKYTWDLTLIYKNDEYKNSKLDELLTKFLNSNESYKRGGDYYPTAVKIASRKSMIFIAIYFKIVICKI